MTTALVTGLCFVLQISRCSCEILCCWLSKEDAHRWSHWLYSTTDTGMCWWDVRECCRLLYCISLMPLLSHFNVLSLYFIHLFHLSCLNFSLTFSTQIFFSTS